MKELSEKSSQNMPMTVIGMLIFVSHLMLLAFFFISGNALEYWSPRWLLSLLFIAVLLAVGLGLLYLAEADTRATYRRVVYGTGITYTVISALLYGAVAMLHFQERQIGAQEAGGLFALFLFFFITGIVAIRFSPFPRYLRRLSYIFLAIFGIYLVALAWKYLFFSSVLVFATFGMELVLLLLGAGAFAYLYIQGTRFSRADKTPAPRR